VIHAISNITNRIVQMLIFFSCFSTVQVSRL
jgi:hypothetical protein